MDSIVRTADSRSAPLSEADRLLICGLRRWRACESAVSMAPDGRVCPARRPQDTEEPAVETALMTHQFISSRYHVKPTSAGPKLMNQNLNTCMQTDTNTAD